MLALFSFKEPASHSNFTRAIGILKVLQSRCSLSSQQNKKKHSRSIMLPLQTKHRSKELFQELGSYTENKIRGFH